ncbi:MAG: fumarylacetoacetate hydrolase family protein [Sphingomonas adhaesiva]|uniref:2-keto-4-pentenoate hydratase n=1 Tax=Sphingomonas adhaesiva TaxID=28212 RepID=UPI002FF8DA4A
MTTAKEIAARLAAARRTRTALADFPGDVPTTLEDAYAIQRAGIALRGEAAIAGWKVGRIPPDMAARLGEDRFIGPVYCDDVVLAPARGEAVFALFDGGSAAFEAEVAVTLGEVPDDTAPATPEQARAWVVAAHIAVEVAGSPVATLPALKALGSIPDQGNNNGQIIGARLPLDALDDPDTLSCTTRIDGVEIARAAASALPGGPMAALAFAARRVAAIGMRLRAGQFVSTGAITGVHAVRAGQRCEADFGRWGTITCRATCS